jgi:Fe-S-cluster-containing hydrogenase component 2
LDYPLQSLKEGRWFKLICGASFQHLPAIRNLVLAYGLAGADCIDVAADPAVVCAARDALQAVRQMAAAARSHGYAPHPSPWLMISLNDGDDPHFRKAVFDPAQCPTDCPRPCEAVCPADAIVFASPHATTAEPAAEAQATAGTHRDNPTFSGVIESRCYGCGRCLPICPIQAIAPQSYWANPAAVMPQVIDQIDAVEIHTQVGRLADFQRVWGAIAPYSHQLKLIAISCTDHPDLLDYLRALHDLVSPLAPTVIWQTDGRPMSGDIGVGTTHAAIKLGQRVLAANLPGFVQLAGGTNHHTVPKLRTLGLLQSDLAKTTSPLPMATASSADTSTPIPTPPQRGSSLQTLAGVAYGSYARTLLAPVLTELEARATQAIAPQVVDTPVDMKKGDRSPPLPLNRPLTTLAQPVAQPMTHSTDHSTDHPTDHPMTHSAAHLSAKSHHLEAHPALLWQAIALAHGLIAPLKHSEQTAAQAAGFPYPSSLPSLSADPIYPEFAHDAHDS